MFLKHIVGTQGSYACAMCRAVHSMYWAVQYMGCYIESTLVRLAA